MNKERGKGKKETNLYPILKTIFALENMEK